MVIYLKTKTNSLVSIDGYEPVGFPDPCNLQNFIDSSQYECLKEKYEEFHVCYLLEGRDFCSRLWLDE